MISKLDIKGFKSIREIHLDCKRINLFIGEPNTGKSNILEALGFLSWCAHGNHLNDFVRTERARDLFYDGMAAPGGLEISLTKDGVKKNLVRGQYLQGSFCFETDYEQAYCRMSNGRVSDDLSLTHLPQFNFIRFYRFQTMANFPSNETGFLLPPKGENLVALLYSSKELRQMAAEYFSPSGLLFVIRPHDGEIDIQKQTEGVAVGFPYANSSDTLQRMVFYTAAIESNKNATLVFEEPEAHAFPYYVKHLAERIAMDENKNQYFIATHNPYLLTAIWEKTSADEVAVFATYYRDYETRVKALTEEDMASLMEGDPFFGVSHLVKDAK